MAKGKTVKFKTAPQEDKKLTAFLEQLSELKGSLADLIQEYDEAGEDEDKLDAMTEALDALEDAWDGLDELVRTE